MATVVPAGEVILILASDIQECHISTSMLTSVTIAPAGKVAVVVELPPSPSLTTTTGKAEASKSNELVVSPPLPQLAVTPVAAKSPAGSPAQTVKPATVGEAPVIFVIIVTAVLAEQPLASTTVAEIGPNANKTSRSAAVAGLISSPLASSQVTVLTAPPSTIASNAVRSKLVRSSVSQAIIIGSLAAGSGLKTAVMLAVAVQPLSSLTITVKISPSTAPVTVVLWAVASAIAPAPSVVQVHIVPPVPVSLMLSTSPAQGRSASANATGGALSVIVILTVEEQPVAASSTCALIFVKPIAGRSATVAGLITAPLPSNQVTGKPEGLTVASCCVKS